ncbi:MAG: hypothetical protein M1813_009418 [Trichoglossum hirsutum]|nr:MAG: hypothetical protein M1813_009418 [Trichoglossum hirsutum]
MRHARLFATALLSFFIASGIPKVHSADTEQYSNGWPYNLPVDVKFWPEDGPFRRRDLEAPNDEPAWTPVGVRKMSGDEGEKFYMDYWMFDRPGVVGAVRPMLQSPSSNRFLRPRDDAGEDGEEGLQHYDNASIPYNPPLLLHTNEDHHQAPLNPRSPRAAVAALRALQNRAFKCPGGTADCSSIGRPNSCCADGEACQIIPNTGLGDVGCCPVGKGCSGDLKNCDLGFTKCSDDLGGGCCIPDYVCVAVGCESTLHIKPGFFLKYMLSILLPQAVQDQISSHSSS